MFATMGRGAVLLALCIPAAGQSGLCTWCPRVLPKWKATYAMNRSTIVQPCNGSGLLAPASVASFAVISFDWSNAKAVWVNQQPMDAEGLLVEQAALVKAAASDSEVWVYRNIVKAL